MWSLRNALHAGCGHQLASPLTGPSAGWSPMPNASNWGSGIVELPWKHTPGRQPNWHNLVRPHQGGGGLEPPCPDPPPCTQARHLLWVLSYSRQCPIWALEVLPKMMMSSWKTPQWCLRHRWPMLPQRCLRHHRYMIPCRCLQHQCYTLRQQCLRHCQ